MADSEGKTAFEKLTPAQQEVINNHVKEFVEKYGKYMNDGSKTQTDVSTRNQRGSDSLRNYVAESALNHNEGAGKFLESVESNLQPTSSIPRIYRPNTINV